MVKLLLLQGEAAKFPPGPLEPMPASPKADPPLAKAKPIHIGGSTSGITDVRRGRRHCARMIRREECVRETTQHTPRSVEKEREEVLQALELRFHGSLWEGLMLNKF